MRISRKRSVHPVSGRGVIRDGSGRSPKLPPPGGASKVARSSGSRLKIAENIFDQDHSRFHNDAEVHCSHRKQIRAFALDRRIMAKNSANGMFMPDDNRAAEIAKKNPLNQEHQQQSEDQIVQNRVRRHGDK